KPTRTVPFLIRILLRAGSSWPHVTHFFLYWAWVPSWPTTTAPRNPTAVSFRAGGGTLARAASPGAVAPGWDGACAKAAGGTESPGPSASPGTAASGLDAPCGGADAGTRSGGGDVPVAGGLTGVGAGTASGPGGGASRPAGANRCLTFTAATPCSTPSFHTV